jgi:hypothetical protein
MKNFRDLMNAIEGKAVLTENKAVLTEAINYAEMLDSLFNRMTKLVQANPNVTDKEDVLRGIQQDRAKNITQADSPIAWAKQYLKKSDRITWYLRWKRITLAYVYYDHCRSAKDGMRQVGEDLIKTELKDFNYKNGTNLTGESLQAIQRRMYRLDSMLRHYLSLPVPKIQNYQWGRETPDDLMRIFASDEEEWKEKGSRYIDHDENDGEKIINCGDQYYWVLLPRGYCDVEAKAMGHCGNAGASSGDRIISLRRLIKEDQKLSWVPYLTFILDENQYLGEMKGRGNDKPAARYHPMIIKLLESKYVKGIKGGGYMPENNFAVSDLPEETQNELFEKKPNLATTSYQYKKFGWSEELGKKVINSLANADIRCRHATKDYLIIEHFASWVDLLKEYGDRETEYCADNIDDTQDMNFEPIPDSLWDDLPNDSIKMIGAYYAKEQPDLVASWEEEEDEEFDPNHLDDVWNLVKYEDGDIMDALRSASMTAQENGAQSQMFKALKATLDSPPGNLPLVVIYGDKDQEAYGTAFDWDMPANLALPMPYAMEHIIDKPEKLEEIESEGWFEDQEFSISVPHYGWDGWDKESGVSSFFDEFPQFQLKVK